ncbi:MAG: hydrogenase expression/formation protein HypE [Chloroflexi bacterium]|nr:hydrogenase expression/formation protein HypE [Chloroflexota bacterium]
MTDIEKPNLGAWACPIPLKNYPTVVMGHGSGGKMMADLINHLFVPEIGNDLLAQAGDATILEFPAGDTTLRLAFTTDSFTVNPLFFPGGNIGELAVNGTVNDLAMSGAQPLYLSAGFIIEEGLRMETLGLIVESMKRACEDAGVQLVTGDTKVVNRGHGDGIYINTSGIGVIPEGIHITATNAQPGDVILVNGTLGDHGMAIMSVREGLAFESTIKSDSAALNGLVSRMLEVAPDIHCLRDATRSGLAAVLNELATASAVGIEFDEVTVPVDPTVQAACEILGLDPLYVANEGKLVAFVPEAQADAVLAAMRAHPLGVNAARIGQVVSDHPGIVVAKTGIGGSRIVDLPAGELLPRIC